MSFFPVSCFMGVGLWPQFTPLAVHATAAPIAELANIYKPLNLVI